MTQIALTLALSLFCLQATACAQDVKAPSPSGKAVEAPPPAAAGQPPSAPPARASGTPSEPFLRLKRFDIMDRNGFGQPVVAASFLAPSDWNLEGGARWNPGFQCPVDMVSIQARLTSPDGRMAFEIFPNYMSQWSSDPGYNQMMSQAVQMAGGGCAVAPPVQAAQFVSQVLAPGFRQGARMVDAQPNQELAAETRRKALQTAPGAQVQVDATRTHLVYGDQEEWVVATVLSMASSLAGMPTSYIAATEKVMGFRAPRGELEANQAVFAVILSSMRVNPQWQQAVQQAQSQITRMKIAAIGERSRMIAQAGDEFRAMMREDWRRDQEAFDYSSRRWSEYMRGVQTYADPFDSGTSWELNSGFEHVWKTPSDEFILTNDHLFNPNIAFPQADWNQMQALQ